MRVRRRLRAGYVAVVALLALTSVLPLGAVAQDLEEAEARKDALEQQIAELGAQIDEIAARIATAEDELVRLGAREEELEAQAGAAAATLETRARATFMRGDTTVLSSLLTADGPTGALDRARMISALSSRDLAALESSTALRKELDQTRGLLAATRAELQGLQENLAAQNAELQAAFAEATDVYEELKSRAERQIQISNGVQNGTYACIFDGPFSFTDSWGAPRSGGRSHQGTDVMAAYGQSVYAFTDGYVQRFSSSGLGGTGLYLYGDDGVQYYYAHLSGFASGIYVGMPVEAGQLVAYNGDSGNARGGAPHVHFEVHPGGGGAVNPYPWLAAACWG